MIIRQVSLNFDSLANKVDQLRLHPRILQELPCNFQEFLRTVSDKMDDMDCKWNSSLYGVDDVTAPHHSLHPSEGQQPAIHPQFYQLLRLPVERLSVEFIDENNWNNRSHDSQRKILSDMEEYRRYFKDYLLNSSVDVSRYSFTSTLYYTYDTKKQKLKLLPYFLSGWNILQLTSCLNDIIHQVKKDWDIRLNVMLNHQSFLKFFKNLFDLHPNVFQVCKMLLQSPNMLELMHQIIAMLAEKGNNLISTVKASLIQFVETDKHRDQYMILKQPKITVSHIKYTVQNSILNIKIYSKLTPGKKIEAAPTSRSFDRLISDKDFYDCIFQSTQQLTNYFLERRTVEQEIHRMANSLSQLKSKMVHLTVDYDSLYGFIKSLEKTMNLDDYRQLIGGIKHYLLTDLESKLLYEYQSGNLNNTFQLYLQFLVENSQHWQQPSLLMEHFNSKSVSFPINAYKSPLKFSFNCYSFFDVKDKNSFSNCFALHIYRSYFTTSFMLGNLYVLGYKKGPKILHLTSANSIHEVDMENLQWVLWITRKIPQDLVADSSKVIGLYIIDLFGNLYQLSQQFKNLVINPEKTEETIDIHNLIPVVPSNISIKFNNSQKQLTQHVENNISNQTITLNINVKTNAIRQSSFKYPAPTLLHCLRFSGSIQARISSFCKAVGTFYDGNSNLTLKFTQNDTINYQPQTTVFENLISETLSHIEKMFENITQIDKRDKIVQENLIVFHPGISLKKNYIVTRRFQEMRNRLQVIQIQLSNQPKGSVTFDNSTMLVKLSMEGLPKNAKQNSNILTCNNEINFLTIQALLVDWLIDKFQMPKPYINTKFEQKVQFKPSDFDEKGALLDAILLTQLQQQNCRMVVSCLEQLKPKKYYNFEHILVGTGPSNIRIDGTSIKLVLNVRQHHIHPFSAILAKILQLQQQPQLNAQSTLFTQVINGSIFLYHCHQQPSSLIIVHTQNMKVQRMIKPKTEKIDDKTLRVVDDVSQFKGHAIYILMTPKSLTYNILDWPTQENLSNHSIVLDQKITLSFNVLLSNYTTTDIDKIKLTFCQKSKPSSTVYDNKVKLQDMAKNKFIDLTLLTRNIVTITFWSTTFSLIKINEPVAYFPHRLRDSQLKAVEIMVNSINQLSIDKTRFMGVWKNPKQYIKHYILKADNEEESVASQKFKIFKQPAEKVPFIKNTEESSKVDFEEILKNQRHLNVVKQQRRYISKAGVQRKDVLVFCDDFDNPVHCNTKQIQIFFEYMDNPALKMYPQVRQQQNQAKQVHLIWQPFVRGRYRLYINNVILNTGYQIIVCASQIDRSKTEIMLPNIRSLSYCQTSSFTVKYKDRFGNIFSDLEHEMFDQSVLLEIVAYEMGCSQVTPLISQKCKEVDRLGCQTCDFSFNLPDGNDESVEKRFNVNILFMREFLEMFELSVKGLSVEKRRKLFNSQLEKINKSPMLEICINRYSFLEKLLTLADTDLKRIVSIRFDNEPGVDAGGLRREFFDLVGIQLKNAKYPFFKPIIMPNKTQYMLNPQLLKNNKKEIYMKVFGKLLANSILNNYLIGIQFADAFIKALYGKQIEFSDMKDLVPANEYSRYQMLLKCKQHQIQGMMLDFTVVEGGKQVQLEPGGADKEVKKSNVNEYLDKVADYYIRKRYDNLIESFLKGFNEVFDFELMKKWFRPHEISIFTCGIKTIDADTIIQVLAFDNSPGTNNIKDWFKRYIREADTDLLTKFLKFVTGSSSIPFDTAFYKIQILFVGGNTKKLPISHTCWKSLEVPLYSSYAIMQKKLTAAFTFGAEGFGFG